MCLIKGSHCKATVLLKDGRRKQFIWFLEKNDIEGSCEGEISGILVNTSDLERHHRDHQSSDIPVSLLLLCVCYLF